MLKVTFLHGDEVISQIEFVQKRKDGLRKLQKEIVNTLNEIVREPAQRAGINNLSYPVKPKIVNLEKLFN